MPLSSSQFYESTDIDLTGEAMKGLTSMHMVCYKEEKYHKKHVTI